MTTTKTTTRLRLASYNIRKALGTDRRRDPGRVLGVIADLAADVVVLQEADYRLPPRPPVFDRAQIFDRTGLVPVSFGHGRESLGWHGNALLIRPELALTAQAHHDLPGLEPRGCVEAVVGKDGHLLRVVGVHLGLLRASRRRQLSTVLGFLGAGSPLPTLIAGDFNERSLSVGLGRLAPQFRILSGGPTYHSRYPVFPLDRMAVSAGIGRADLHVHRSETAARASDHLPLVAEIVLGG